MMDIVPEYPVAVLLEPSLAVMVKEIADPDWDEAGAPLNTRLSAVPGVTVMEVVLATACPEIAAPRVTSPTRAPVNLAV